MSNTNETIEQWLPLVTHVGRKHFPWMYGDSGHSGQARRSVDSTDLEQEGTLALWDAIRDFDPRRAQFKTFAYRLIYNRMASYLSRTCSALKTARIAQTEATCSSRTVEQLKAALKYRLFTEMEATGPGGNVIKFDKADEDADPATIAEREEFVKHCMGKLEVGLDDNEWEMLNLRMHGWTYDELSNEPGVSIETARKRMREVMAKCQVILYAEGVLLDESDITGQAI